jgi:outer membrane protein assembly factor BamD
LAESEAEEQSRTGITFKDRALLLVKRGPVTVNAARIGEPTMTDAPQVTAPDVHKQDTALFTAALTNKPLPSVAVTHKAAAVASGETAAPAADGGSTLTLENVQGADSGGTPAGGGPQVGASIVQPGEAPATAPASSGPPTSAPAAGVPVGPKVTPEGAAAAAEAAGVPGAQNPGGLEVIRPANNNDPLPPIEKPAEAPAQTNDVQHSAQVQTGTDAGATPTTGKKKKPVAPKCNQNDESCSKEKKKKGLDKLNPF